MSYNGGTGQLIPNPVVSLLYRDMGMPAISRANEEEAAEKAKQRKAEPTEPSPSKAEIAEMLKAARAEAAAEVDKRLRREFEAKSLEEASKVTHALQLFQEEQKAYFSRVESEVVHLALAISSKILHREAQVDPTLVAALVRVAVENLHDGSSVTVRISPLNSEKWRKVLSSLLHGSTIAIVEDEHLGADDCILETDLGSANFSIDAQLKEVERGFFDLLAQRPTIK